MFIVNKYCVHLSLHQKHQSKFPVCEILRGNKIFWLNGALLVVLTATKNTFEKLNSTTDKRADADKVHLGVRCTQQPLTRG